MDHKYTIKYTLYSTYMKFFLDLKRFGHIDLCIDPWSLAILVSVYDFLHRYNGVVEKNKLIEKSHWKLKSEHRNYVSINKISDRPGILSSILNETSH